MTKISDKVLENIDRRKLETIKGAIDLALANGRHSRTIELIAEGRQRFPEDADLQKLASILAPPKVIRTNVPASPGIGKSMRWLKENRTQYSGQWVAVKDGVLLGRSLSRQELSESLAKEDSSDILITKIPEDISS